MGMRARLRQARAMEGTQRQPPGFDRFAWLEELERDTTLHHAGNARERANVLDRLEAVFPDSADREIDRRVAALRAHLETADRALYATLRAALAGASGRERLLCLAAADSVAPGDHYDHLDDLVAGLLQLEAPGAVPGPEAEMVSYQPTPARHVFDLLSRTTLGTDDVLVDLGSGLGHVPLLAGLCSDARAIGIELQAAYVERARAAAASLRLARVAFIEQDARAADFSVGTVFYLYTPFSGSILRAVLDALRMQSLRRPIRICSYGPCTVDIARESWLTPAQTIEAGRVAVFGA